MGKGVTLESAVRQRSSDGARHKVQVLCCPVRYDAQHLRRIPAEIIEREYGCGDPSKHVHEGETVLDLGSGGGKICYIAAQVVGRTGRAIGKEFPCGRSEPRYPRETKGLKYEATSAGSSNRNGCGTGCC